MGRVTLYGFYNYDPTIFDDAGLPELLDKDILVSLILKNSGMLFPWQQEPVHLKKDITLYFKRKYLSFDRMAVALNTEYNALENYDRTEESTTSSSSSHSESGTHSETSEASGTSTASSSSTDTDDSTNSETRNFSQSDNGGGSNENTVSAFNSDSYTPHDKAVSTNNNTHTDTGTGSTTVHDESGHTGNTEATTTSNDSTSGSNEASGSQSGQTTVTSRIHGNIGVTTSQQMLESELKLREYDVYEYIAQDFENEFLMQIY